jgi:hypothetical protein
VQDAETRLMVRFPVQFAESTFAIRVLDPWANGTTATKRKTIRFIIRGILFADDSSNGDENVRNFKIR